MVKISASLLAADLNNLEYEIEKVYPFVDSFHIDSIDSRFADNPAFNLDEIKQIKKITDKPLKIHSYNYDVESFFEDFVKIKINSVILQYEIILEKNIDLREIRKKEIEIGVAISPETPVEVLEPYLFDLDEILILTVNPGYGGQNLKIKNLDKLHYLQKKKEIYNYDFLISVDGGVNQQNFDMILKFLPNEVIIGTGIFKNENYLKFLNYLQKFRGS